MRALVLLLSLSLTGCVWSSSHPRRIQRPPDKRYLCTLIGPLNCDADGWMCSSPCKEGGMAWWILSCEPGRRQKPPDVPPPEKKVSSREDKRPDHSSGEGIGPTPRRMQMHWIATGEPPP